MSVLYCLTVFKKAEEGDKISDFAENFIAHLQHFEWIQQ